MEQLTETLVFNVGGVKPRYDRLHDRDHLVVPTVAMVQGVLNGNKGPILYENVDMKRSEPLWDHRPLVVYHPRKKAADQVVLNTRGIGITLSTLVANDKMGMESWIDVDRAKKVDRRVLDRIDNGKPVEVSTGLGIDFEPKEGEFGGRKYIGIARNYRPDHLAILPDQIGASSLADGAGLLRNSSESDKLLLDPLEINTIMSLAGLGRVLNFSSITNERSFQEINCGLYSLLQARYGYSVNIIATYDDTFVFQYDSKIYRLGFSYSDREVSIEADPVEVYQSPVSFVAVNTAVVPPVTAPVEESSMTKLEMINHLKAHGGYTVAEDTVLNAMSDQQLDRLVKACPAKATSTDVTNTTGTPQPQAQQALPVQNGMVQIPAAQFATMQRMVHNYGIQEAAERTKLIPLIMAQPGNIFKEEFLKNEQACSLDVLRGIAAPAIAAQQQVQNTGYPQSDVITYDGAFTLPFGSPVLNRGQGQGGNVQNGQGDIPVVGLPGNPFQG